MNHQDLINTCVFEQIQGLLFSDLSGPLIGLCNHVPPAIPRAAVKNCQSESTA